MAGSKSADCRYTLSGTIAKMNVQRAYLAENGFEFEDMGPYPALRTLDEFHRAVLMIWEKKLPGWYCYHDTLHAIGVSHEDFAVAMALEEAS